MPETCVIVENKSCPRPRYLLLLDPKIKLYNFPYYFWYKLLQYCQTRLLDEFASIFHANAQSKIKLLLIPER